MRKVLASNPSQGSLRVQFKALYHLFRGAQSSDESLSFDLSQLSWVYPSLILPISAYIYDTESNVVDLSSNQNVRSYLDAIGFPDGVDSVSEFEMVTQRGKSYVPISVLIRNDLSEREKLESMFRNLVYEMLDVGSIPGMKSAIFNPISELVNNIFEHSQAEKGFLFGQFYPNKDFLDICIVDRGRGLARGYAEEQGVELSDADAIERAMRGVSTKSSEERGYGLHTSKNTVVDGFGGEFALASGSAVLISSSGEDRLAELADFSWQGVLIAYRIPKPSSEVDWRKFVE